MPIILAIEPDRRQAAHVSAIVRQRVGAELILADTTEGALDAIGSHVPDLVLVPALLSPQDDAALNAALRVIAAAAHVRTLTIPVFANGVEREERGGLLSRWRRGRSEPIQSGGCDPAVFAEQISEYLREAAAERAALVESERDARQPIVTAAAVVETAPIAESDPVAAFEPEPELEPFVEPVTEPIVAAAPEPALEMPARETFVQPAPVVLAEPAAAATAFETDDAEPLFAPHAEPAFAARAVNVPALDEPEFEEPIFEFAAAPEPVHSFAELMHAQVPDEIEREEAVEATDDDALEDDEVLIDLSEDLAEISPETSADELFDGERVGVYTMPSFDTDEFDIDADVDMPIAARSRYDVVAPTAHAEPAAPLDLAEFGDDELLAAFGAIDAREAVVTPAALVAAVTTPEAPIAPVVADVIAVPDAVEVPEIAVPAVVARNREDGWLTMGIRHVWAWPTLEGVTVEAPSLAGPEEFSDTLAAAVLLPKPPVALPRPHVVPQAPKTDHMEWAELIASLRQDIERRRNQPAPAPQIERPVPAPAVVRNDLRAKRKSTPIQDEWGFFDPHQCGFAALLEKLDQITDADDDLGGRRPA